MISTAVGAQTPLAPPAAGVPAPPPQAGAPAPPPPPPEPPPAAPPEAEPPAAQPPAPASPELALQPEVTAAASEPGAESAEPASEELLVTGSRIRDSVGKQAPVTTLSEADLQRPGLVGIGEVLQRLPASGSAINGTFNSSGNQGNPPDGGGVGAGATEIDLRYFGSKRTLVLVDGMRWINGSSASGVAAAVDLNTIPLNMIERIEVLEDGASPIYGSDAIAGVVNIITKKHFDGVAASAYLGGFSRGDGITQKYDLTVGNGTGRLSILAGASYINQSQVRSRDLALSRSPVPTLDKCESGCSGATPQGRIVGMNPNTGESFDLTLNNGVRGVPNYPSDYHTFRDPEDRFNFSPYNLVLIPSRRVSAFSSVIYRITDSVNLHGRTTYTMRESVNQAGPEPLFIGPEGGTGTRTDRLSIDATNPYNPFGFTFDAKNNPYVVTRRPLEAGPRRFEQTVNTLWMSGGFDGTIAISDHHKLIWDTSVGYGVNRAAQRRRNAFNSSKLKQALGPAYVGADGQYRCGTVDNPGDSECVPFNIFGGQGAGGGSITRQMLDYVTYTQHDVSEQRMLDWVANISGPVLDLPAGPLAIGIGAEHRRLQGDFEPDAVVAADDSADIPARPTIGKYHVTEAYGEVRAPLLAKLPLVSLLDVNAAGRVSDYSFLDPELTGKFGGRWKPIDDLVIRASYGLGFRAPSIGELYGAASRFDATIIDPCSNLNRPGVSAAVRQRCVALGVPSDGSYNMLNPQTSVATGGSSALQPERSKSLNVSIAYAPAALQDRRWSDRFDIEVAYYQIVLDGAIAALDSQLQLDRCVAGDNTACTGITRTGAGTISSFNNRLQNINGIKTRGIDLKLFYQTSNLPFGRLRARWLSSWLLDYWEKIPNATGIETVKLEGLVRGEPERAFPQLKSNLTLEWLYDDFGVTLGTRYIHGVTEPCRGLAAITDKKTCSDFNRVDDDLSTNKLRPKVYNDVRVTWNPKFDDRLTVMLGVNNVFNVAPPTCFSCALNGFNGATWDVPGVFGYLSAGYATQ